MFLHFMNTIAFVVVKTCSYIQCMKTTITNADKVVELPLNIKTFKTTTKSDLMIYKEFCYTKNNNDINASQTYIMIVLRTS